MIRQWMLFPSNQYQGKDILTSPIQHGTGFLATSKEKKHTNGQEQIKLALFMDNMIISVENPKE